jgi:hypothetical protein
MPSRLPPLAILLGAAGLIPFIVCGLGVLATDPTRAARMMTALIAYGAVILAFLGAVHWGFALASQAAEESGSESRRLALGVLPALAGWVALLLPIALPPIVSVALLLAGFIMVMGVEAKAGELGLMPPGYLKLRWGLSAVVVAMLVTVLTLRLLGVHVLG